MPIITSVKTSLNFEKTDFIDKYRLKNEQIDFIGKIRLQPHLNFNRNHYAIKKVHSMHSWCTPYSPSFIVKYQLIKLMVHRVHS